MARLPQRLRSEIGMPVWWIIKPASTTNDSVSSGQTIREGFQSESCWASPVLVLVVLYRRVARVSSNNMAISESEYEYRRRANTRRVVAGQDAPGPFFPAQP